MESRTIQLTSAAHKHGNLNIHQCGVDFFPKDVFDGPYSDMSFALRMYDPTEESRVYQGWYCKIPIGPPPPLPEDEYQKWTRNVWESLGDEESLYDALLYAISQQTNLWDPNAPVNAYRLKGHGFFWEIFLRNN